MNQVLISTSMDLLMDDELAEETLLMEKATLLLQEIEEDKMMSPSTSKSNKPTSPSVEKEKDVKKKKSKSKSKTKKTKKVKKSVRFASDDKLTCVEYLTPRSTRAVDRLFYSDDDMQWMLHQLQCDVTAYEQHGAKESATFSCRGLERRTACGSAQRARWRKTCRTVVLDEQDRQWLVLPMDEPVDEQRIAFVSLEVTHKAKQLARKRAIQDERDIRKDLQQHQQQQQTKDASSRAQTTTGMDVSWQTDGTGRSSMGCSYSCSSVEEDCCGCSKQHHHQQKKHNRKGHSVHFPAASRQMFEVHEYQHVANDEESKALWHPYLSLNDAKLQYASQIAILEQQQQQQQQQGTHLHAAASSSSSTESSTQAQDEESTRGLEARTTQAETTYEQLRTEFSKTLRLQALDPAVFSKQCQKLSAKSRKQARTRALMDQRAVKVLQQSSVSNSKSTTKKLVTRVPKVRTASPPKDGGSSQSNKSPTRRSDSPKPLDWKDDSFHGSSHSHGTVKRAPVVIATTAAQEETAEEPSKPRGVVHRVGDWSSVGTLDTMDSTLLSSSSSTLTMPSGSLSSMSQAPDDDMMEDVDTAEGEELDQVCRSSKPTRRSLPDLSATLMMTTTTVVEQPRRHSSAMYRLSKVTEEDYCSDDEEEVDTGIPKAVLVGIPDKYFGRNSKSAAYKPSAADLEALQESIAGTPLAHDDGGDDQGLMDDKSAGGDGSGRLSGIIERLWDKRRGGKGSELVHNQTMMDAAI